MRAKWLKFGILASIKVRASGQCIAPKTRTTLILDRYMLCLDKHTAEKPTQKFILFFLPDLFFANAH